MDELELRAEIARLENELEALIASQQSDTPEPTGVTIDLDSNSDNIFNIAPFGNGLPFTGKVVLSPGPGLDLGLSPASACACCAGDLRLYIYFFNGVPQQVYMLAGSIKTELPKQLLINWTGTGYYKVSYLPGDTDTNDTTCCKCLTNAYELSVPQGTEATTWQELHNMLKPRGTTAKDLDFYIKRTRQLEGRLGLDPASPNTASDSSTADDTNSIIGRIRATC